MAGIGNIPAAIERQLKQFLTSLKETAEVGEGQRGNPLKRYLKAEDLLDLGLAKRLGNNAQQLVAGKNLLPNTPVYNSVIPPAPTGFTVSPSLNHVLLEWDKPLTLYSNHAYTEIYRSTIDNVANAVLISQDDDFIAADLTLARNVTYYYWIRFVSTSGIKGPFNSSAGKPASLANDPADLLAVLSGQITETELYSTLNSRIDLIDTPVTGLIDSLAQEVIDRGTAVTYLQGQIDSLSGTGGSVEILTDRVTTLEDRSNSVDGLGTTLEAFAADYFILKTAVNDGSTGLSATYGMAVTLQSRLNDVNGYGYNIESLASSYETLQSAVNSGTTGLSATYNKAVVLDQRLADVYGNASNVTIESFAADYSTLKSAVNNGTTGLSAAYSKAVSIEQRINSVNGAGKTVETMSTELAALNDTVTDGVTGLSATYNNGVVLQNRLNDVKGDASNVTIESMADAYYLLESAVNNGTTGLSASYTQAINTKARLDSIPGYGDDIEALASLTSNLSTTVGGHTTTLSTQGTSIAGLEASYTVKIDNNGHVAGYGLASTTNAYDGMVHSTMLFSVDAFAVASPGATSMSFVVDGGVVVMDGAFIKNATINTAQVGSIAVDKITGITSSFLLSNIGTANIGRAYLTNTLQSDNYVAGASGLFFNFLTGYAEFQNIKARGDIEATSVKAGSVDVIDTLMIRGQSIVIPRSSYYGNSVAVSANTWENAASISITATGAPIEIKATMQVHNTGGTTRRFYWAIVRTIGGTKTILFQNSPSGAAITGYRRYYDGVWQVSAVTQSSPSQSTGGDVLLANNQYTTYPFSFIDSEGLTGVATYEVYTYINDPAIYWKNRSLIVTDLTDA